MTTTRKRNGAFATVAVALALIATGCGGKASGSGAGQAPGGASQSAVAQAQKYSQCMRSHGVPDYPDPNPTTGRIQVRFSKGPNGQSSGVDPGSAQYKTAAKACKSLQPPGLGSSNSTANAQMIKFAQCMRAHGVKNFPDPKGGRLVFNKSNGLDPNSPQFKAAQRACQKYAPGGNG